MQMMNFSFYLVLVWEGISITLNSSLAYIPNSCRPAPLALNVFCEQSHKIINITVSRSRRVGMDCLLYTFHSAGSWVIVSCITVVEDRLDISLEAGVGNRELMITVMDMETSYVIVVYSNHISFTTSVQPNILCTVSLTGLHSPWILLLSSLTSARGWVKSR